MSEPILLVVPTLSRGGAERVFVDLAGGLASRGREVHLAWASGRPELAPGIAADVHPHDLGASRTAAAVPELRRLVSDLRPTTVLSALFHGNLLAAAATRGRRRRPALVFTEHIELGPLAETEERRLTRWSPYLIPVAYRMADAVVAVSAGVADGLREITHLPRSLVHQIPNPVDLDRVDRLAAEGAAQFRPAATDRDVPLVVAVGRLVPVKRFDLLIRALAETDEPAHLVVLGEGPERVRLEALATDLGVAHRVDLPGAVDNPYAAMAGADLVVSSSRSEALPTVLIEALHLRRPVVATHCSRGVREVTADGVLAQLVPVDDPTAMAQAIGERLAAGRAAEPPRNAMARYRVTEVSARYDQLIDQIS